MCIKGKKLFRKKIALTCISTIFPFSFLERSLDFTTQIRFYVSDVVFYCADYFNLLPVVHYQNNRRRSFDDEPKSFKEIPVLGEEPARGLKWWHGKFFLEDAFC